MASRRKFLSSDHKFRSQPGTSLIAKQNSKETEVAMQSRAVILATTAILSTGPGVAEISLGGSASMGVEGGTGQTTQFFQDVDVIFSLSGETDAGLSFGASVDLDEAGALGNTSHEIPYAVYFGGGFGTVTLGDTDSAFQFAVSPIDAWGNPGSLADNETAHWGRQGDWLKGSEDGQVLRYDYTHGDLAFAVSFEQDDASDIELENSNCDGAGENCQGRDRRDLAWGIGFSYSPRLGNGQLNLGVGYETAGRGSIGFAMTDLQASTLAEELTSLGVTEEDIETSGLFRYNSSTQNYEIVLDLGNNVSNWGASAGYEMDNGLSFGGVYTLFDGDAIESGTYWGVGLGYAWKAYSVHANYGEHAFENTLGEFLDTAGWGLAMGYDLGGGLSVLAGYGHSEATARGDFNSDLLGDRIDLDGDTYSIGLKMDF